MLNGKNTFFEVLYRTETGTNFNNTKGGQELNMVSDLEEDKKRNFREKTTVGRGLTYTVHASLMNTEYTFAVMMYEYEYMFDYSV